MPNKKHAERAARDLSTRDLLHYYRNLRYHRYNVLEGIRLVAFRNVGKLHEAMGEIGLDRLTSAGDVAVVQDRMLAGQGVPADPITRMVMGWITFLPWEVYLCLLYAEIESYQKTAKSLPVVQHSALSDFLQRHETAVDFLRAMRHKTLHPQKELVLENAQAAFVESAGRSIGHYYELVFQVQERLDTFIAWLRDRLRQMVVAECETLRLPDDATSECVERSRAKLEELVRLAPPSAFLPLEPCEPLTGRLLTPVHQVLWGSILDLGQRKRRDDAAPQPVHVQRAASGAWRNVLQSVAFTGEILAGDNAAGLLSPWTAPSPAAEPSPSKARDVARRNQQVENRRALMRVASALIWEPIKIYREAVRRQPFLRDGAIEELLPSATNLSAMKSCRDVVFHVADMKSDPVERERRFWTQLGDIDWPSLCQHLMTWNPPAVPAA